MAETEDLLKLYWEERGKSYHREGLHPNTKYFGWMMSRVYLYLQSAVGEWQSMIELGCGTGHCLKLFHGLFPTKQFTGVDISSTMLEAAKEYLPPEIPLHLKDIRRLQELAFADGSYDLAFTNVTLIHIPPEDIEQTLQQILQIAKAGVFMETSYRGNVGTINVKVPASLHEKKKSTKYYFNHDYPALFEQLGFHWKSLEELDPRVKRNIYYVKKKE